jgi:hypothetical protein
MSFSTKVFTKLLFLGSLLAVRGHADRPFACDLKALSTEERTHHKELSRQLASARMERRQVSDGYSFRIDSAKIPITRVAEWVELERKCCPFFRFQIELDGESRALWLTLRGREGIKKFIEIEFS